MQPPHRPVSLLLTSSVWVRLLKQGRTVSMCPSDSHVICSKEEAIYEPVLETRANLENTELGIQSIGHPQRAGNPCSPTVHYAWIRESHKASKSSSEMKHFVSLRREAGVSGVSKGRILQVKWTAGWETALLFRWRLAVTGRLLWQPAETFAFILIKLRCSFFSLCFLSPLLSCCHVSTNRRNPNYNYRHTSYSTCFVFFSSQNQPVFLRNKY